MHCRFETGDHDVVVRCQRDRESTAHVTGAYDADSHRSAARSGSGFRCHTFQ